MPKSPKSKSDRSASLSLKSAPQSNDAQNALMKLDQSNWKLNFIDIMGNQFWAKKYSSGDKAVAKMVFFLLRIVGLFLFVQFFKNLLRLDKVCMI